MITNVPAPPGAGIFFSNDQMPNCIPQWSMANRLPLVPLLPVHTMYRLLLILILATPCRAQQDDRSTPRGARELATGTGVSTGSIALSTRLAGRGGDYLGLLDYNLRVLHSTPALT